MGEPSRIRAMGSWMRKRWLRIYLVALVASHLFELVIPEEWYRLPGPAYQFVEVGGEGGGRLRLAYLEWKPARESNRPPVILLHGCPGQATDFVRFGPRLAGAGYRTIAIDQIGFGESTHWARDYSIAANARAVLDLMSELKIARAHVLGWSNGGGTALWMADDAPQCVASVTMMAAIGLQEEEGSGSYFFEHAKYGAGLVALVGGGELVPHFGLLGPTWFRHSSMRFFWDTDQRELWGVMERMGTPVLVLHGRDDFLVPARAAEEHHRIIGSSRLVMMHASHFIPFLQAEEGAEHFLRFSARHDEPGVPALRQVTDLDPEGRHLFGAAGVGGEVLVRSVPWWVWVLAVGSLVVWRQRFGAVLAALAVNFGLVDLGVVVVGIVAGLAIVSAAAWGRGVRQRGHEKRVIGRGIHARSPRLWGALLRARPVWWGLGSRFVPGEQETALEAAGRVGVPGASLWISAAVSWVLWALLYTVPVLIGSMFIAHPLAERFGEAGLLLGVCVAWALARVTELLLTRTGRRVLRMRWARTIRREYWPTAVLYAPLVPRVVRLAMRHGLMTFTCCNPGISGGGGVIGESKREILDAMDGSARVLPAELVSAGPDATERSRLALSALRTRPELGGFPVILKPDEGQRGFAVKLARGEAEVEAYFREVTTPVLVQRFDPGPHECGVLWMRKAGEESAPGVIYSVTRKEFPFVTGDGTRTLEELVWRHPRFRNQAGVFLERFADERDRIPAAGETVRLAQSGNHCQGTLFRDGEDLITPELTREIDRIASGFKGGLDMARLDVRYESEESLRRGEGFGIVELNGTAGESTNIYDPERSIAWCYRVLGGQCQAAYELGAARKRAGARVMSVRELLGAVRKQARERRGSEVAD